MSTYRVSNSDAHEIASPHRPERSKGHAPPQQGDDLDALMARLAELYGAFEQLLHRSPASGTEHRHGRGQPHAHAHSHSHPHSNSHTHRHARSQEGHTRHPVVHPPHPPQTEHAQSDAHTLADAQRLSSPQLKPVLRGDEKSLDDGVKTQEDFGRLTDSVAKDYGLDPNMFRAQINAESGVFDNGDFRKAMQAEGDLDRRGENNTSIGLGQISRKFLDGREWSGDGPGNPRLGGGQVVTTEQYMGSPTIQLRMAASNLSQRIEKYGGLEEGLAAYVSGNPDPNGPHAQHYLGNIERGMSDPAVYGVGR